MEAFLVTGGTGTLGRHVVRRLNDAGHDVRVLTRRTGLRDDRVRYVTGDLMSGAGLGEALEGAGTIVHCAGASKGDEIATANLVAAASRGGQGPHVVYISVVGADRVPMTGRLDRTMFGYFEMKRKAEGVVTDSGLPWTTLRATQFHDLILTVLDALTKSPIVPVPSGISFQPVDADEVAARMVELALGEPSGLVPDFAGPRTFTTGELFRGYLSATRRRRVLMPLRLPGTAARAVRSGANLPSGGMVGSRTWESFLAERLAEREREARSANRH
jgi:uncharacterized protein YbjT (DUF2867 family)